MTAFVSRFLSALGKKLRVLELRTTGTSNSVETLAVAWNILLGLAALLRLSALIAEIIPLLFGGVVYIYMLTGVNVCPLGFVQISLFHRSFHNLSNLLRL